MIWFYYLTVIVTLGYFLFAKRRFDLFSIASFSSIVYFLPGLFGYVMYPLSTAVDEEVKFDVVPINDKTYIVFIMVLLITLIFAMLQDYFWTVNHPKITVPVNSMEFFGRAIFLLLVGSFILSLLTTNIHFFNSDKTEVMKYLNRFYTLWTSLAIVYATTSFLNKHWKGVVISMVLLLFDVFVGFRTSFSIAVIALFLLWLHSKGKQRLLINNLPLVIIGAGCAGFIFLYKNLMVLMKLGRWNDVIQSIFSTDIYVKSIVRSEPFVTQAILNRVIENHFFTGLGHFKYVAYQFIVFSPSLGVQSKSFNDLFQPVLFPDLSFGMANNIWAEMYSSGGWLLVILFSLVFCMLISVACHFMKHQNHHVVSFTTVIAVYWAFYIHRNDLLYQINIEKNIVMFLAVVYILSVILRWWERGKTRSGS
ncbi:hypothetical protein [Gorillibacterium sp. sgz5001074]|uniref:hypothetical protein n=1 Tax=Gorillibacterium sp. sgz5001074 TaxID=3446695 RepID=UPI003F668CFA